ncbi:MAG: MATE family efflux transporter [Candidatus Izemoplasmatales bacterium]|nr:MATE family efflux transporter [Candidatus Izemoplasmatales bacterium]
MKHDFLPLKKRLKQLVLPLFIENGLAMTIGISGTIMIANYDNNAASAIGVTNMVIGFFHLMFMIISVGTGIIVAQYVGAKMWKQVSTTTAMSLVVNFVGGFIGSLVIFFFAPDILKLVGLRNDLLASGLTYIRIVALSTTFQAMSFSISAVIRSYGYTSLGMKIAIIPNIVNISLNYLFIYGFPQLGITSLGVLGVGISAAISQTIGFSIFFLILTKKIDRSLSLQLLRPFPKQILKDILKIGVPSTGENISYQVSQIVVAGFITTIGVVALNTRTYYANIAMFIYLITVAFTQATAVMVGNLMGEGRAGEAYQVSIYSFKISITSSLVVNILFVLFIVPLISMFTTNPEIIALAKWIVIVDIGVEMGRASGVVFSNSLKASGDVRFPVYLNVIVTWTMVVPLAYFLGIVLGFGLIGVWAAFAFDELLRGTLLFLRWRSRKWTTKAFINRDKVVPLLEAN